jgi:maleylacetoacetate isomerase
MANLPFKALHLYTAPLSGCSARVRIAAHLKGIPLTYHHIDFAQSQQSSKPYKSINPNGSVPSLIIEPHNNEPSVTITQSLAILDFLDTHFPAPPLLPGTSRFEDRARVLELASLVVCDIQPPQNSRIRKKITTDFNGDGQAWARWVYERGIGVYETLAQRVGNARYSVGDEVTIADICLVPAVQGGLRVGIDLDNWPLVKRIVEECWKLEAFRQGGLGGHGKLMP